MLPLSAEIQSGRRDKPDGQTRMPPVSSHLASAGAGPERYAGVVNPPVGKPAISENVMISTRLEPPPAKSQARALCLRNCGELHDCPASPPRPPAARSASAPAAIDHACAAAAAGAVADQFLAKTFSGIPFQVGMPERANTQKNIGPPGASRCALRRTS